jgi:iron complex outermembrane receptor protein
MLVGQGNQVESGRFFANAIDTETGVDLVVSYDWKLAGGNLKYKPCRKLYGNKNNRLSFP